LSATEA
jgi:hypothetical protein